MDPQHTSALQVGDSVQENTNQQVTIYFEECVPYHGEEITLEYKEVDTSEQLQEDKLDNAEETKLECIKGSSQEIDISIQKQKYEPSQQFTKDPIITNVGRPKLECLENLLLEYTGPPYIDEPTLIDEPSLDCFDMPLTEEYLDKLIPEYTEETRLKYVEDAIPHIPYIEENSNSFDNIGYQLQNIEGRKSENMNQPIHDQKNVSEFFGQPEKHYVALPLENLTPESLPESLRDLIFKSGEVENPLKRNIQETRKVVGSLKELMQEPTNETVLEPTNETVLEPTNETVLEPTNETVLEPTNETVLEPTNETVLEPTNETVLEPTNETVLEPTNETVLEPTNETVLEPTNETVLEPTNETVLEPTNETMLEPTNETVLEPTNETVSEPSVHLVLTLEEIALSPEDKQSTTPACKQECIQHIACLIGQEHHLVAMLQPMLVPIEQPMSTIESLKQQKENSFAIIDNTLQNIEGKEFENIDEPIFKHIDISEFFIQPIKYNKSEPIENIPSESVPESAQELTLVTKEIEEPSGYKLQETREAVECLTELMQEPLSEAVVEPSVHLVQAMEEPTSPQYRYLLRSLDQSSTPAPKRKSISLPPLVPIKKPKLEPVIKSEKEHELSEATAPEKIPKILIRRIKAYKKTSRLDEQVPEQREERMKEETDERKETVRDIWQRISATDREEQKEKKKQVKVNINKKATSEPTNFIKFETKNDNP